jgi:hypothetical protein
MKHSERHIIISVDLDANPGNITIDCGNLAPHIVYCVLTQALDVLEDHGAEVAVVHNGTVVETEPEETI